MTNALDLNTRLAQLRDDYTYKVNLLLDEGREDLATQLADQYLDEAARVLMA